MRTLSPHDQIWRVFVDRFLQWTSYNIAPVFPQEKPHTINFSGSKSAWKMFIFTHRLWKQHQQSHHKDWELASRLTFPGANDNSWVDSGYFLESKGIIEKRVETRFRVGFTRGYPHDHKTMRFIKTETTIATRCSPASTTVRTQTLDSSQSVLVSGVSQLTFKLSRLIIATSLSLKGEKKTIGGGLP